MTEQTALVVGASRGLGLALVEKWLNRGWRMIATARGDSPGLDELRARFPDTLEMERAGIVQAASIRELGARLSGLRLDVLFVNAGIFRFNEKTPIDVDEQEFLDMMLTDALAPSSY